ncbi:hypothetical protein EJC49_14945 [Aquibium carbonis]|uniref:Uncharacterized protein n=1 Tax=Aquibium carbonis TaxID=2495581 RepID=A0A3S0G7J2_9HYPH|nr:hypothetical protein [Aquibium carbonis]RST85597.1 hypothetical protein EJC49_14945 [Aquibium carbonis]
MSKPTQVRTAAVLLTTASGEAHKLSLHLAGAVNSLRAPAYDLEAAQSAYEDIQAAAERLRTIERIMTEAADGLARVEA